MGSSHGGRTRRAVRRWLLTAATTLALSQGLWVASCEGIVTVPARASWDGGPNVGAVSGPGASNGGRGGRATGGRAGGTTGSTTGGATGSGGLPLGQPGGGGLATAGGRGGNAQVTGGRGGNAQVTGGRGGNATATGGRGGVQATGGTQAGLGGRGGRGAILPPAHGPFDYQIGGPYTPPAGVTVVSRDRTAAIAAGLYNICYVNGFQIQPQEASMWTSQHPDLVLKDAQGKTVVDTAWNEMLVDTRTAAKRDALIKVIGPWLDGCAAQGFNAVEIDNLDSYGRSQGLLTVDNNVAFMALISARAHASGLAVGQKNGADLVPRATAMGTDFAITEECNRYDECGLYTKGYGNLVFDIEYRREDFDKGCKAKPGFSIVLRDLNVTTPGSSSYVFDRC